MTYDASPTKRRRATAVEMEERANFLIHYAIEHGPATVRQLYYRAEVEELPGIEKTESGYIKVQRQVLKLRREGRLPYWTIADASRIMRKPRSYDGLNDMAQAMASSYRKALWADSEYQVEIWLEKDALAGVIFPITSEYDVPLMSTRGFTSETFAYEAVQDVVGTTKTLVVFALYDCDRAGWDASQPLREKLMRFGMQAGVEVIYHDYLLTHEQVIDMKLPTRPPKRKTAADKAWPYDVAAELDAIPPDELRDLVKTAIEVYLPSDELAALKEQEAREREDLHNMFGL